MDGLESHRFDIRPFRSGENVMYSFVGQHTVLSYIKMTSCLPCKHRNHFFQFELTLIWMFCVKTYKMYSFVHISGSTFLTNKESIVQSGSS